MYVLEQNVPRVDKTRVQVNVKPMSDTGSRMTIFLGFYQSPERSLAREKLIQDSSSQTHTGQAGQDP